MKVGPECSQWTSEGLIIQGGGGSEGEWGQHSLLSSSCDDLSVLLCYTVRLMFSDTAFMFTQVRDRGLWELNNHVVRPVQSSPVQSSVLELISDYIVFLPPLPSPSHPEQSPDILMYNVRGGAVSHVRQWAGLQIWGQWGYNVVIMIRNKIIVRTVNRVTQLCGQLQHSY